MTWITPIRWLESTISLYSPKWALRWLKIYTLFSQSFIFFTFFQNFPNFWTYNRKFEKPITCASCVQIPGIFIYDINNTLNVIERQNYLIFIEISCFRRIKRRDPFFIISVFFSSKIRRFLKISKNKDAKISGTGITRKKWCNATHFTPTYTYDIGASFPQMRKKYMHTSCY